LSSSSRYGRGGASRRRTRWCGRRCLLWKATGRSRRTSPRWRSSCGAVCSRGSGRSDSMSATIFTGAAQVVTCESTDPESVKTGVAVAVANGRIAAVAGEAELAGRFPDAERVDCAGGVVTPGFVDSHTHAVFGRWRAEEYALRCRGVPYMEIARQGGGINA